MRVTVTFRSTELDGALKAYARDKLPLLEHLVARPMQAHVVFAKERFTYVSEVMLTVNGEVVQAVAKHEDAQAALDIALNKLDGRLRRMKGRMTEHRPPSAHRAKRIRRALAAPPEALPLEPPGPKLVPVDATAKGALTPEAAVAELEARGLDVLLFKNARTKRANVVYRQLDGSFGHIEGVARTK